MAEKTYEGLVPQQLVEMYRLMVLSRRIDDREILLKRQQKIHFQVSCAGHEALLVAAAANLRPGYDWFFPYYRDRALCLALGVTPEAQFLQAVGAAADPASGGRQMPSHWGSRELNIFTSSSPTGNQFLQAVGCAEAGRYFNHHPEADAKVPGDYREFKNVQHHPDEVTLVTTGEGTTSQGEFWESLNTASMDKLPVLYLVEDNGYAISTPVKYQTPGGNISHLLENFPDFHSKSATAPICWPAMPPCAARSQHIRSGNGPALVHGHVIRPYSHSLSDDEKLYRPEASSSRTPRAIPSHASTSSCSPRASAMPAAMQKLHHEVDAEVQAAIDAALDAALPAHHSYARHVYSEELKPTSKRFRLSSGLRGRRPHHGRPHQPLPARRDAARRAHPRLRRGCRRLLQRGISARQKAQGQGRSLQAHQRPAAPLRLRARLQLAAGRGQHRGPRPRHGRARTQAGGGDSVLRLHLARHAPAAQ